jgi:hypothetical protein
MGEILSGHILLKYWVPVFIDLTMRKDGSEVSKNYAKAIKIGKVV